MKKYKNVIFLLAVFLFFTISLPALALEVTYPSLFGYSISPTNPTLPQYIAYFFVLAMATAGVFAVFSIVIAGIKLLTSVGNPSAMSDAKERIFGSLLGLALLMGSVILLRTINPQLVNPAIGVLTSTPTPGVYAMRYVPPPQGRYAPQNNPFAINVALAHSVDPSNSLDNYEFTPLSGSNSDISSLKEQGFHWVVYLCDGDIDGSGPDEGGGEDLFFWDYSEEDWGYDEEGDYSEDDVVNVKTIPCKYTWEDIETDPSRLNEISWPFDVTESFKIAYEEPGVYLFNLPGCREGGGDMTEVITNTGQLPEWIQNDVQSAWILNENNASAPWHGFVLNRDPDLKGKCSEPFVDYITEYPGPNTGWCIENIPDPLASSIYVIKGSNGFVGDGVSIYEDGGLDNNGKPFNDGPRFINFSLIQIAPQLTLDGNNSSYPGVNNPDDLLINHGQMHSNSSNQPGKDTCIQEDYTYPCTQAIEPRGNFLTILYAKNEDAQNPNETCGFFTSKIDDLSEQDIISNNKRIFRMDIFPTI